LITQSRHGGLTSLGNETNGILSQDLDLADGYKVGGMHCQVLDVANRTVNEDFFITKYSILLKKSLKIPKGGNQNPFIEEEQTIQWQNEKVQKDK